MHSFIGGLNWPSSLAVVLWGGLLLWACLGMVSFPSWPHRLVSQIALLQPEANAQLGFSIKYCDHWNFILEKGWFCSLNRVVTSQKCQDGKITKENSVMILPINMEHWKLLTAVLFKTKHKLSLGLVKALIRNAFLYLNQSNYWVQCFYFLLMHVLCWRKCLQTWFCYTNVHHIFMVYF